MTWLNPWAWIGLAAIAVPILVHLLARRQSRPVPFPTLRFLGPPRAMLARRDRLTDLALLVVRTAIVASAVAALAQPHVMTEQRAQRLAGHLARAIVVDTSVSMQRPAEAGGTALDAARRDAQRLGAEATVSSLRESAQPARSLAGAAAWLATQPGRRELVVVSDFQSETIGARDVAGLSPDIGVRLLRIGVQPSSAPLDAISTAAGTETTARVTLTPTGTRVEWTSRERSPSAGGRWPEIVASDAERRSAEAALDAAQALGAPPLPAGTSVAIVFPGSADRARLLRETTAIAEPWMFDAIARLRRADSIASRFDDIARAEFRAAGRGRLMIFSSSAPEHVASAALIAGVLRALSPAAPPHEIDPTVAPDDTLRGWERAPAVVSDPLPGDRRTDSDGRWFWGLALVLLAVEAWMRRRTPRDAVESPSRHTHARVA
jgi:hypothetical protein